ncbi:DUF6230 family protein [Longispora sp. NPDC051575]|uniref:DUF6230 family protein n=1 Tax=Longispora sp. NPDC051575 TaxID=3154943 RepID=UPI0034469A53
MKETLVGRTRWRKFAIAMVPATAAAAVMVMGMSNGAIAASFAVSGQQFQISADEMVVDGFAQYGSIDKEVGADKDPSKVHVVAVAAAKSATVKNLCQSVVTPTPIGTVTMQIHAGGAGSGPVTAENLFLDMTSLTGDAVFENIEIGVDASTMTKGAGAGMVGGFGQQASRATITNVKQVAWATNAGTFRLKGMHLEVLMGNKPCF